MAGSRGPGVVGGPEGLVGAEHGGRDGQREVQIASKKHVQGLPIR